jgi:phage tail sheath protein FI
MAQYSAPGVYVEEVSSGIKPIAGVGTSTAGFVGVVADDVAMPARPGQFQRTNGSVAPIGYPLAEAGKPQLITGWEGFKNLFGDFQLGNLLLAHAVYGFFNNGGSRCWVIHVAPGAGQAAEGPAAADTSAKSKSRASSGTQSSADATTATTTATATATATAPAATQQQIAAALDAVNQADVAKLTAALDVFKTIDEIALVAIPGATAKAVQQAIVDHCENEHLQDRFAILDGQPDVDLTGDAIRAGVSSSSYGAIYFPWISVFDPVGGGPIAVPPSGHIAGIYARVDAERGVYKAPANQVIRGALDVARPVGKEDQVGLNPGGVNVIRKFGGNVTVWGARTLASGADAEWQYVNVRRLFLFLRESIDEGTQWVVFEPNTPQLWAKIRRNISAFLTTLWNDGALFGNTPAEAFYVRCDETTNPPEVRALGQVVTEVGVAVVRPAEFVIFRVSQWAGPGSS